MVFPNKSSMHHFNVSRLNTDLGIFRISGLWRRDSLDASKIEIITIEIMGTDGWVLLNQSCDKVINLVKELRPVLQAHLDTNSS